jgi:acetoin utilization deacetylase AcuC-like enzyme
MTLLYSDPRFLDHDTGAHAECAARLRAIHERLDRTGLAARCRRPEFLPCSRERVLRLHTAEYLQSVWAFCLAGGGHLEPDTAVSAASYDVALLAAGAVCDAARRVVVGEDRQALCLVRPPGHHALADRAMGFCLLNNVALAARLAIDELGLDRVLVVDWDVHHGNGTQAAFWEEPRVGFLSLHRYPFYPGSGAADETGGGPGLGATLNLPIAFGTSRKDCLTLLSDRLAMFAARIRPQLVLLSAGFDAHCKDPIGNLGLETEDYITLTDIVLDVAGAHCDGRVVSVLEGGYNPAILAQCVELHLDRMLKRQ